MTVRFPGCMLSLVSMVAHIIQKPVLAFLMAILIFNLTQRRHLNHGEKKRFASLGFACLVLIFYVGILITLRFDLPDMLLIAPLAIAGFVGVIVRKRLQVFRVHCATCSVRLPITSVLYYDDNLCPGCRNGVPKTTEDIDWDTWIPDQDAVLCFIIHDGKILLIRKKKGLGAGKVNAPGGRIESGESPEDAALRECREEVGLIPGLLEKRADLSFEFTDGLSLRCSAFFFLFLLWDYGGNRRGRSFLV